MLLVLLLRSCFNQNSVTNCNRAVLIFVTPLVSLQLVTKDSYINFSSK